MFLEYTGGGGPPRSPSRRSRRVRVLLTSGEVILLIFALAGMILLPLGWLIAQVVRLRRWLCSARAGP